MKTGTLLAVVVTVLVISKSLVMAQARPFGIDDRRSQYAVILERFRAADALRAQRGGPATTPLLSLISGGTLDLGVGRITGDLTKTGAGTLPITGGTASNGATLILTSGSNTSNGTVNSGGGTLTIGSGLTFDGTISGIGRIGGTTTIDSGATTINTGNTLGGSSQTTALILNSGNSLGSTAGILILNPQSTAGTNTIGNGASLTISPDVNPPAVPEPGTATLLVLGAVAGFCRRHRTRL